MIFAINFKIFTLDFDKFDCQVRLMIGRVNNGSINFEVKM